MPPQPNYSTNILPVPVMFTDRLKRVIPLCMGLCIFFCLYFLTSFLFTLLSNYFPGPFYDYWVDISKVERFYNDPTSLGLRELLSAHNEAHRIFIPRLLFIMDYVIADGSNVFLISISLLCKFAILVLFNINLSNQNFQNKIWLNGIFFAGIFSLGNISNIIMTSNVQWDLMLIFSFLALHYYQDAGKNNIKLTLSCLFLITSFLSHGASLVIPMVFFIHAMVIHNRKLFISSVLLFLIIMLLHFTILPGWTGERATMGDGSKLHLASLLLSLISFINFVLHFLYAPVRHLGAAGLYFSAVYLLLFVTVLLQYRKQPKQNNFFSLLSLFLALTILIITAGRVITTPKFYWASQYEPITIMFLVSVSAAIFINPPQPYARWFRIVAISHCLLMLLWNQFQPYPYGYYRSNKALDSHAYMFMYDRDQYQGDALKIWVMDPDPVKAIDPFFDEHNFAYYHNKQGGDGAYRHFIRPGEVFMPADQFAIFIQSCRPNHATIDYQAKPSGKYYFSTAVNLQQNSYLSATLNRNSYYVLDKSAKVIGFSFVFMPPQSLWPMPVLKGLTNTQEATYITEVIKGEPRCRYVLTSP